MADSLRLRILNDALTKLNASPAKPSGMTAILGGTIQAAIPSLHLYLREDEARRARTPRSPAGLHHAHVEAECRAAGSDAVAMYRAVDPLTQWAVAALDGVILDGAILEAEETNVAFEIAGEGDRPYIMATVRFSVAYQQKVGDAALQK
ncbi:MAG: hypothetical protein A2V88_02630 [Elusimicrobia bacterium RBG_16_66_12]|nr:MAG: hypothetical protein A2V88_02630 [Elusimicrobia bacterium RBG_16_66_12]